MSSNVGDAILVLRRAAGITQEELAARLNITQATLSRYENNLRAPDDDALAALAKVFGVTERFLQHDFTLQGAIAGDAHMRRQKTTKPSDWKRVESRLNALRMHSNFLLERVPLRPRNFVIQVDPFEHTPQEAATMLRASWRMPIGPVRGLYRWIESAGVVIVEEDFGTHRIDGMSQWAGDHAVIILNAGLPTDRKRLTAAHELGHLVMHSSYVDPDVEDQANAFAAEFLMPEPAIRPQLNSLSLGKLADLKREWGVSMQAIFERAYRLGKATVEDRHKFYRQLNSRGWKTREPFSEDVPPEVPQLADAVANKLKGSGLSRKEIIGLIGGDSTPFSPAEDEPPRRHLSAV
ncbi:XRE family transcriptional regulator [Zhihengliuella sp.]|uniref:helix-turn-helix domain-containing protein n=1 Tax=Zhihengliuella sp. TaxID=1954483 RepID=UPI002811FE20|nr:XRE family transcriptional regulator [Zhihengliuella sp.]